MTEGERVVASSAARTPGRAHLPLLGALAAMALGTLALAWLSPMIPWPIRREPWAARGAFVLAFAWVSIEALGGAWLARRLPPPWLGGTAGACTLGLVGLAVLSVAPSPAASALVGALLVGAGASAGAWVGQRIQHPGHLGVVAVVSSIADAASVLDESGPTAQLIESEPALSLLALAAPMLGTSDVTPILGVGDVVMSALYAAALTKHGLPERRTWGALAAGLALAMLAVLWLALPLPALPFLGACVVAAHPSTRLPPPDERRAAALALAIFIAAALFFVLR